MTLMSEGRPSSFYLTPPPPTGPTAASSAQQLSTKQGLLFPQPKPSFVDFSQTLTFFLGRDKSTSNTFGKGNRRKGGLPRS